MEPLRGWRAAPGGFLLPRGARSWSQEQGARIKEQGARSKEPGARSKEQGALTTTTTTTTAASAAAATATATATRTATTITQRPNFKKTGKAELNGHTKTTHTRTTTPPTRSVAIWARTVGSELHVVVDLAAQCCGSNHGAEGSQASKRGASWGQRPPRSPPTPATVAMNYAEVMRELRDGHASGEDGAVSGQDRQPQQHPPSAHACRPPPSATPMRRHGGGLRCARAQPLGP
jgi:hypothetical protein